MQTGNLYSHPNLIVGMLQRLLAERADPAYAEWYRHNVKPTAPVRGVRMQDLRHLVMAWHEKWQIAQPTVTNAEKVEVTFLLLHADFVDDRLAAMVFIDEILIGAGAITPIHLDRFATLFPPGYISDFKACDHFAAKVLQRLLIQFRSDVSEKLSDWFRAQSVWQARAALSALTPFASDAIHDELLLSGCSIVLARPEEEAKSIVGSALRALGRIHPELVENFLNTEPNLVNTNAACLNKATSFLGPGRAQHFREQKRMLTTMTSQQSLADHSERHSTVPVPGSAPGLPLAPHSVSSGYKSEGALIPLKLQQYAFHPAEEDLSRDRPVGGKIPPLKRSRSESQTEYYQGSGGVGPNINRNVLDNQAWPTSVSISQSAENTISPVAAQRSYMSHSLGPSSASRVLTQAQSQSTDPRSTRGDFFSLSGTVPVTLPYPTGDDRFASLNRVAHGRITRSDSGLRRPIRRIHDAEQSLPPQSIEALESSVHGERSGDPERNVTGTSSGRSEGLEGENEGSNN